MSGFVAEPRKRPGVGMYANHRMARAIPLSIQAVPRKRPGDLSGPVLGFARLIGWLVPFRFQFKRSCASGPVYG